MRHRKVTLDEIGCCAMTHAFLRHPRQMREWGGAVGQMQILYEIFGNTMNLSFMPDDQTSLIYRSFAAYELARIASAGRNTRLLCRHKPDAHAVALGKLLGELPKAH